MFNGIFVKGNTLKKFTSKTHLLAVQHAWLILPYTSSIWIIGTKFTTGYVGSYYDLILHSLISHLRKIPPFLCTDLHDAMMSQEK